ncbi:hypothetical protein ACH4OY_15900 [Micromonospora rubida]|uniref:Uncharacterized protein n=1 Tax=Micromonospora rubida TaxID=2697657 RepID=A0ABW7SKC9_9ACTN
MTARRLPLLIRAAWHTLEWHRHRRCSACCLSGWCPLVQVAKTRITAWRRFSPVQFIRPIMFRLIKVRTDLITYDGWTWIEGYELDAKGDAVARRELFVLREGIRRMNRPTGPTPAQHGRRPGNQRPG